VKVWRFAISKANFSSVKMKLRTKKMLFPEGRIKALTMSYDDGKVQDKRLVEIFNRYGIRGTFNINSGLFDNQDDYRIMKGVRVNHSRLPIEEIQKLYKNHEVAIHTLTHANLKQLPKEVAIYEVIEDKKNLEELFGYPIRGMAYPFGAFDEEVIKTLSELRIEYSRTVRMHGKFSLPSNFLAWEATCHHGDKEIMNLAESFLESTDLCLFYVWGHSYEFDIDNSWERMEEFCRAVGNNPEIWYATNIEIVDYVNAVNSLKFSTTGSSVYNPSGYDVWVSINNKTYKIDKGSVKKIDI
jgi:peptidoglycan/xylan/chitin deacetylase (PgdA/CDA1 family)